MRGVFASPRAAKSCFVVFPREITILRRRIVSRNFTARSLARFRYEARLFHRSVDRLLPSRFARRAVVVAVRQNNVDNDVVARDGSIFNAIAQRLWVFQVLIERVARGK